MKTSSDIQCSKCPANCKSIFNECKDDSELVSIKKVTRVYEKGETIIHEGSVSSGVYCLGEGTVKVFKTDEDGSQIILKLANPGTLIGHTSIFKNTSLTSAVAIEETKCCFFESSNFQRLLKDIPILMLKVLRKVEEELGEAQGKTVYLMKKNVRERTASYFSNMAETYGVSSSEGVKINLKLSREEMASFIGTAHETTTRFISEFKAMGLIKEEDKFFYVLRLKELQQLAGK